MYIIICFCVCLVFWAGIVVCANDFISYLSEKMNIEITFSLIMEKLNIDNDVFLVLVVSFLVFYTLSTLVILFFKLSRNSYNESTIAIFPLIFMTASFIPHSISSILKLLFLISVALNVIDYSVILRKIKPFRDYSGERNFDIIGKSFRKSALLPKNYNLFEKSNDFHLSQTILPNIDMNDYNFDNVCLANMALAEGTILPRDKSFLQKVKDKRIRNMVFPVGDYSIYDFSGVILENVVFKEGAKLPEQYDLFKKINICSSYKIKLPKSTIENIHLYDLRHREIINTQTNSLSDTQVALLTLKKNKVYNV